MKTAMDKRDKKAEQQILQGLNFSEQFCFENFYDGGNQQLLASLRQLVQGDGEFLIYLVGAPASGRSHLLQACCQAASKRGSTSAYLPLKVLKGMAPNMLEDLEQMDLVCIDDVESIAGDRAWEEALFHLYNRLQAVGHRLLVTAACSPVQLPLLLPDLRTRLSAGICFSLKALDDSTKVLALQTQASFRGMQLPEASANYLLRHHSRDMNRLIDLLNFLDQKSLQLQRGLTVPFIKDMLESRESLGG